MRSEPVGESAPQTAKVQRRIGTTIQYVLLTLAAIVVLFPMYLAVVNSLHPLEKIFSYPPSLFVTDPQWSNYVDVFDIAPIGRYLVNSFLVSALITVGQVATSVLAAYAFAFLRFPLRTVLFALFLSTLMVPWEVTIIPNYETVESLGWLDSYQGLTVPFLATAFGTFLLRQAFLSIPRDLLDAAALDGAGHLGVMRHVAIPLGRPAIAALAVFSFLSAWNQYLWPLLITNDDTYRTVQIGLKTLASQSVDSVNLVMAGTVIAAAPTFILLVVFQRHLIRGISAGGVKG
ncbi:MAG TPA: carbohydrate ABC transporter permease [Dehalococcoidia bacterium]|nr:carbohydrate ABC transporter permease [Dehalococcoidia bacterium]